MLLLLTGASGAGKSTETVVQRALELQGVGRHVLLAGDPVAPGEVIAAPSADKPNHMPHVLSTNGWAAMRWDRLRALDPRDGTWTVHLLETSARAGGEVAEEILVWCRRALRGQGPLMRAP
jgi:hypothetical protein